VSNKTYSDVTLTSNTTLKNIPSEGSKDSLVSSLSAKWAHESGFSLDKIKYSGPGSPIEVENSLTKVVPNLKLEFQGNDTSKGDLLATYTLPVATLKAKVDIMSLGKTIEASATGGNGPITAGAQLKYSSKGDVDVDVSAFYKASPFAAGVTTSSLFKKFDLFALYDVNKEISVAAKVTAAAGADFKPIVAATYKCNPNTDLKAKLTTDGVLGLSIKQKLDKTLTVAAWAQATASKGAPVFGLKATLAV